VRLGLKSDRLDRYSNSVGRAFGILLVTSNCAQLHWRKDDRNETGEVCQLMLDVTPVVTLDATLVNRQRCDPVLRDASAVHGCLCGVSVAVFLIRRLVGNE